jgi:hypothetical protein
VWRPHGPPQSRRTETDEAITAPCAPCGVEPWTTPLCPPLLWLDRLAQPEADLGWRAPLPGVWLDPDEASGDL